MDIDYCSIILPEFDETRCFTGVFSISESLHAWIIYDKSEKQSKDLFSFIISHKHFVIQIKPENRYEITGFDCLCLTPIVNIYYLGINEQESRFEPINPKGLIKIKCNLWVEGILASSINSQIWHSVGFKIPYAENWFDSKTESLEIVDNSKPRNNSDRPPFQMVVSQCPSRAGQDDSA